MGTYKLGASPILPSDGKLMARNHAGTLDLNVLGLDSSDKVVLSQLLATSSDPKLADHTSISLLTPSGSALTGGGDLSANRTLQVVVDASTIEIATNTIRLKDAGITSAKLASSVYTAPAAFTPTIAGAAGSVTTSTCTGYWSRVSAKVVQFVLQIVVTDVGTATGDLTITLPAALPAAGDLSLDQPLALHTESITEASVQLTAKILTNTKTVKLYDVKTNAAADILDIENGTIQISGSYITA